MRRENEEKFTAILKKSNIFGRFARILAHSSKIRHLEIYLGIRTSKVYEENFDGLDDTDSNSDTDDTEHEDDIHSRDKKEDKINKRVVELFLDSGILNPLSQLSNVKNFKFLFLPFKRKSIVFLRNAKITVVFIDLVDGISLCQSTKKCWMR